MPARLTEIEWRKTASGLQIGILRLYFAGEESFREVRCLRDYFEGSFIKI